MDNRTRTPTHPGPAAGETPLEKSPPAVPGEIKSAAERGKTRAADDVERIARALRRTSEELEREQQPSAARALAWAADGLRDMSGGLRERDLDSVLHEAERIARREPALFFGGALTTGFLLARFLKSSARSGREEEEREARS